MPTPRAFSRATSSNSRCVSVSVSEAVGSSRISTDTSPRRPLAISTICCCARDRPETGASTSIPKPRSASIVRARSRTAVRSSRPALRGSSPRLRFCATESVGTSENSWNTALMPWRRASCTLENRTGAPCMRISPEVGTLAPAKSEISVDLPAPFSPNSTCTSPARSSKSTPSSASTPG